MKLIKPLLKDNYQHTLRKERSDKTINHKCYGTSRFFSQRSLTGTSLSRFDFSETSHVNLLQEYLNGGRGGCVEVFLNSGGHSYTFLSKDLFIGCLVYFNLAVYNILCH